MCAAQNRFLILSGAPQSTVRERLSGRLPEDWRFDLGHRSTDRTTRRTLRAKLSNGIFFVTDCSDGGKAGGGFDHVDGHPKPRKWAAN
jgi:hypothetical protein